MKLEIVKKRVIVNTITKILRKLNMLFFTISILFLIVLIARLFLIDWIYFQLLGFAAFGSIILWIFFNMVTNYYTIGEIIINENEIAISLEEDTIFKISELKHINIDIHEYQGQSYGIRSVSVYQGVSNYITFIKNEEVFKLEILIKGKKTLAKIAELVKLWKSQNIIVTMKFRGNEVENFEFL